MSEKVGRTIYDFFTENFKYMMALFAFIFILWIIGIIDLEAFGLKRGPFFDENRKVNTDSINHEKAIDIDEGANKDTTNNTGEGVSAKDENKDTMSIINENENIENENILNDLNYSETELTPNELTAKEHQFVAIHAEDYFVTHFDKVLNNGRVIVRNTDFFQKPIIEGARLIFYTDDKIVLDTTIHNN